MELWSSTVGGEEEEEEEEERKEGRKEGEKVLDQEPTSASSAFYFEM